MQQLQPPTKEGLLVLDLENLVARIERFTRLYYAGVTRIADIKAITEAIENVAADINLGELIDEAEQWED